MPPHLHPRSTLTTSLLTTTLLTSFVVVALPHVLPCPAPRKRFAESTQSPASSKASAGSPPETAASMDLEVNATENQSKSQLRECPVPRPSGLLGQLLGFTSSSSVDSADARIPDMTEKGLRGKKVVIDTSSLTPASKP
jgi:cytochrome c oxidase assembly factor 2